MEQWKDSGYLEWLDNFGGKFKDRHFGFEDGKGLSIVRILVLREMEDLRVSILRTLWCLTRRGVTRIGDS